MKEMEDAMRALDAQHRNPDKMITELVRDLARLQAKINEVLKIHRARKSSIYRHGICTSCSWGNPVPIEYPCQTAQALGVTREGLDALR